MRFFYFIVFFLIIPLSLAGQLTAPGSGQSVRYTSYSPKDPVFFYCNVLGTERGTLTAVRPGGTGNYDFSWFKWNDGDNSFSTFIRTDAGITSSTVTDLDAGGYRVIIDSSGTGVAALTGWIFFDTPPVSQSALMQQLCDRLALDGRAEATTLNFNYRNPATGASMSIPNEITFLWSSDPSTYIPAPDFYIDPIIVNIPPPNRQIRLPLENVTFKLQVNSLGCSSESSFFYESIHVKADFTVNPLNGEAPLEVSISDNSVRGDIYTWDFGDDTISHSEDPGMHTFYKPGQYTVLLKIESNLHCVDSLRSETITVEPSSVDIPNVFTPDDDGYNDRFRIDSKSLRYVSMEVYSQSGIKVYGFSGEGERLKSWEGWDGRVNNSSVEARPGVYFYIIRAIGWDDVRYDGNEYRGFVYLYR